MYAEVLTELKAKNLDQTFTYQVPSEMMNQIQVGSRVLVPFGKQVLEGFVLHFIDEVDFECKEIIELIDLIPVLNEELLHLGNYMAKKTLTNRIICYQTMLPKALKAGKGGQVSKKLESYFILKDSYHDALNQCTTELQKKIIDHIKQGMNDKKSLSMISNSALQTLLKKEIISLEKREVYRKNWAKIEMKEAPKLTKEQENVIESIRKSYGKFQPFLLHGVTGSGKTEVYIRLIQDILQMKKKALVLVPEISLTPQLVQTFQSRFGEDIAILHSMLSAGEKYDEWRRIVRKEVSIVIGARSAIFAPLEHIGMIIIDEEQSQTYKQENSPKYYTHDIALQRAKVHHCPIILGSATPSIESYTRAKLGIFKLLEMKNRVYKNVPKIYLVDMKDEIKAGRFLFSKVLEEKIKEKIEKKEQVILLLNRRGYSTVVSCHQCGYTQKCPHCDIPLTYHKTERKMRCHYCGYLYYKMNVCPECKSKDINEFGLGTQKLEEEVRTHFNARILRMDADTTSRKNAYEQMIQEFKEEKYDILIGTQMIAKGLNFPKVTLVGVLNVDASLQIPDFRSSERTYELLSQVAGRAGRFELPGEVIFQGFNMDHYSIQRAQFHDYVGFYNEEILLRKKMQYPPYTQLIQLKIVSKDESLVEEESMKIKKYLQTHINEKILGPSPCNLYKWKDQYHYQILIKSKELKGLYPPLTFLKNVYNEHKKVRLEIDFNPLKVS